MSESSLRRDLEPWQFSIAQWIGATTLICFAVGVARQLAIGDRHALLLALVGIAVVSAVLSAIYAFRVWGHAVGPARVRHRRFSRAQLGAALGLLAIAVGASRSYVQHPEI